KSGNRLAIFLDLRVGRPGGGNMAAAASGDTSAIILRGASRSLEFGVRSHRRERRPRLRVADEESLLWRHDHAGHFERTSATKRVRPRRDHRAVRALSRRWPPPAP